MEKGFFHMASLFSSSALRLAEERAGSAPAASSAKVEKLYRNEFVLAFFREYYT